MSQNYLKSVTRQITLDNNYQTIVFLVFNFSWQQEEIMNFTNCFFKLLNNANLVEKIEGADRLSSRFTYHNEEFILNIECICESIWIEVPTCPHEAAFHSLYQAINTIIQ